MALTKPAEDARIPCNGAEQLHIELEKLFAALAVDEAEDTWEKLERAVIRFAGITRGGGYKQTAMYLEGVGRKGAGVKLVQCMLSDRGRLSGAATDLLATMAPRLAMHFAPLATLYLPPVIKLLARPNKVFLRRAEKCLLLIVSHCPIAQLVPLVMDGVQDKNEACRRSCSLAVKTIVNDWDKALIGTKGIMEIEAAMRKMATDKDPEVRKAGKAVWEQYKIVWPERVDTRYLDIGAATKANRKAPVPPKSMSQATTRPPNIGSQLRMVPPRRDAAAVQGAAIAKSGPSTDIMTPSGSATRALKSDARATSQPSTKTVVSRTSTVKASSSVMKRDRQPPPSHQRSFSATDVPVIATNSSLHASTSSISRPLGGMGRPVRPTIQHAQTAAPTAVPLVRKMGALSAGPSRPVRLPSSLSLKNVAEHADDQSAVTMASSVRPVRPRVLSGQMHAGGLASIDRMAGAKAGFRRVVSGSGQSPTPKTSSKEPRPLAKVKPDELPQLSRTASSSQSGQQRHEEHHTASRDIVVTGKAEERIERPRARFRPGPTVVAPGDKRVVSTAPTVVSAGKVPGKVPSKVPGKVDQARSMDASQSSYTEKRSESPLSSVVTSTGGKEAADEAPLPNIVSKPTAPCGVGLEDATMSFPLLSSADDLLREPMRTVDMMADMTLSTDSSVVDSTDAPAAYHSIFGLRRSLSSSGDGFFVPTGQRLAPKDVPLPPSPPSGDATGDVNFPSDMLRHKPSIAHSLAASSSNETVPVDWDSDATTNTDDDGEEDPMNGVKFKSPARRGLHVKPSLFRKAVVRAPATTALPPGEISDLLQFSEASEAESDRLQQGQLLASTSTRDPPASSSSPSGKNVSPKIAALTHKLLSKSANTLHSTPSREPPANGKATTIFKARGFTPVRNDLDKLRASGSTTPLGTPPVARRLLGSSRRDDGAIRHGMSARSH